MAKERSLLHLLFLYVLFFLLISTVNSSEGQKPHSNADAGIYNEQDRTYTSFFSQNDNYTHHNLQRRVGGTFQDVCEIEMRGFILTGVSRLMLEHLSLRTMAVGSEGTVPDGHDRSRQRRPKQMAVVHLTSGLRMAPDGHSGKNHAGHDRLPACSRLERWQFPAAVVDSTSLLSLLVDWTNLA